MNTITITIANVPDNLINGLGKHRPNEPAVEINLDLQKVGDIAILHLLATATKISLMQNA